MFITTITHNFILLLNWCNPRVVATEREGVDRGLSFLVGSLG